MAAFSPFADLGEPPDVLHRFVSTPFRRICGMGSVTSNEEWLADLIANYASREVSESSSLTITVTLDANLGANLNQPLAIQGKRSTALFFGEAAMIALDHDNQEVFGFISRSVDIETIKQVILPALFQTFKMGY